MSERGVWTGKGWGDEPAPDRGDYDLGWFAGIGLIVSGGEVLVVGRRPFS